jgi:DNA-binding MarR family transcriptional regulator
MELERELKIDGFESSDQRAIVNIVFTGNWLNEKLSSMLRPHGLSPQQFNVLRILKGQGGKPISVNAIQDRMLHKVSNVTRVVDKLKEKGLLERRECPSNRRQLEISITDAGLELLDRIEDERKALEKETMKQLSESEKDQLSDLLDKLRNGG